MSWFDIVGNESYNFKGAVEISLDMIGEIDGEEAVVPVLEVGNSARTYT